MRALALVPEQGQILLPGLVAPSSVRVEPRDPATQRPHDLVREFGPARVRCQRCGAAWRLPPRTRCPEVPLYRGYQAVPEGLLTRTSWARRGVRIPHDAPVAGVLEATGSSPRRMLYRADVGRPVRPMSPAAQAALARRLMCRFDGCGVRGDILRSRYGFLLSARPEDRLCADHYVELWEAEDVERRRRLLADVPSMLLLDLETTGLDRPHILEVGVWGASGLVFSELVRPPHDAVWEPGAIAVNGIHPEDVATAQPWASVRQRLLEALAPFVAGGASIGAWGPFDARVLAEEEQRLGGAAFPVEIWDARRIYRSADSWPVATIDEDGGSAPPLAPSARLAEICAAHGVRPGTHRAADDARAAYEVLVHLRAQVLAP